MSPSPTADAGPHVSRHEGKTERRIASAHDWSGAEFVGQTITIDRPRDVLYAFWRDLQNLPRIMDNIERIEVLDDRRSHWVVKAPMGETVAWEALITEDVPGEVLAWESLPDADVKHAGRIEFRDGPPGRGSEIKVTLAYEPPAGAIGKLVAKLFQREPQMQARQDLRRFKQLMETGEISTTTSPGAAPRAD